MIDFWFLIHVFFIIVRVMLSDIDHVQFFENDHDNYRNRTSRTHMKKLIKLHFGNLGLIYE
jgi:hypothetical protein